ncbi:MAG: hypothetical protein U0744_20225 [Gemmataceae bacterium]
MAVEKITQCSRAGQAEKLKTGPTRRVSTRHADVEPLRELLERMGDTRGASSAMRRTACAKHTTAVFLILSDSNPRRSA